MTEIENILREYGVKPDDVPECMVRIAAEGGIYFADGSNPIARINAHIPSVTSEMDAGEGKWADLGPRDDDGDYIGDMRICACGKEIHGFYEYVDHLKEVLS